MTHASVQPRRRCAVPSASTIHPQRKRDLFLPRPRRAHHRHNVGVSSAMARCLSRSFTGIRTVVPAPTSSTQRGRLCESRSRPESSAEHLLQEAEATVRTSRPSWPTSASRTEEAVRRMEGEMQAVEQALQRVQDELATERGCRQKAEQERDDAIQPARRPRRGCVTRWRARRRRKILRPLAPSDRREERRTPAQSVWPRTLSL